MPRFEICIGRCSFCDRSAGRGVRLVGNAAAAERICLQCVSRWLDPSTRNQRGAREAFVGGKSRDAATVGTGGTSARDLGSTIAELEESIRSSPDDVRARLRLGDLFSKEGRTLDACAQYEVVADTYSNDGFLLKAVAVCKQVLKLNPGSLGIHERLAALYTALGLLDDAAESQRLASLAVDATRSPPPECSFCQQPAVASDMSSSNHEGVWICISCLREARAVGRQ